MFLVVSPMGDVRSHSRPAVMWRLGPPPGTLLASEDHFIGDVNHCASAGRDRLTVASSGNLAQPTGVGTSSKPALLPR